VEGIYQVAVVADGKRPAAVLSYQWLGVSCTAGAGGRVADVSQGDLSLQPLDHLFVKYCRDQSHAGVVFYFVVLAHRNASTFLSSMLQSVQTKIRKAGNIVSGSVYPEDSALLVAVCVCQQALLCLLLRSWCCGAFHSVIPPCS